MIRMLLAESGEVELLFAGDTMRPAVLHGQRVIARSLGSEPVVVGETVVACRDGIPELLRVVGRTVEGPLWLQGDSEPGERVALEIDSILARVPGPQRRPTRLQRRLRRLGIDLEEAWSYYCDPALDDLAETVRAKYDVQAPGYASCEAVPIHPRVLSRLHERIPAGGRLLVAGSGAGRECFELAQHGWQVRGVDFSRGMIDQARRGARERTLDVTFVQADLRRHAEPPGSLDAVLFTPEVYSFLPHPAERVDLLGRMAGWLDRDGVLLISARPVQRGWERLILTLQWWRGMRSRGTRWGDSHARCVLRDGTIHRSFVHYFTQRKLRREMLVAGLKLEDLEDGRAEATRECQTR
jgi:SAM-dependent methyltransferase